LKSGWLLAGWQPAGCRLAAGWQPAGFWLLSAG